MVRNIVLALALAVLGLLLLIGTFVVDHLYHLAVVGVAGLFTGGDAMWSNRWLRPFMHATFLVLLWVASWPVLRSRLGSFWKATCLTVPLATTLVTVGIFLHPWPAATFSAGAAVALGTLAYLYRAHKPWLYSYATILVSSALGIFTLLGGEP